MENKLREYFTAGTRLVWYVDPKSRSIDVYTSPSQMTKLGETDILRGGEVPPTFEIPVSQIFQLD